MKLKFYIFQIALAFIGMGVMSSCEDILEPTSTYVIYEDGDGHLRVPSDTATSLVGIIYKLQAIGDRTNLLGEVRGDLVTLDRSKATADLIGLADFDVTDENRYNNPRDYYAVINNCNYYIAKANMNAYDNRGNQIFLKEVAQVHAIRAWVYLQLALNYGEVPFYTEPLLTEQDVDKVTEKKGIEEICDFFIQDLLPYQTTPWPQLQAVGSVLMTNCIFPVQMVLGDLYLWKASYSGSQADYRQAASMYFSWISANFSNDGLFTGGGGNDKRFYSISNNSNAYWTELSSGSKSLYMDNSVNYQGLFVFGPGSYFNEAFTIIPMDSAASQGYFNRIRELYSTIVDPQRGLVNNFCIIPSRQIQDISNGQSYYNVDDQNESEPIEIDATDDDNKLKMGDLRLSSVWRSYMGNFTEGGNTVQTSQQAISKMSSLQIMVYRKTDAWLRLAEALNNGGYPRLAYAILATGVSDEVLQDSVMPYCSEGDWAYLQGLNTSNNYWGRYYTRNGKLETPEVNTIGIHSRGSGYAELNPEYAYPMVDSLNADGDRVNGYDGSQTRLQWAELHKTTEQVKVDSLILNEMALETCFEGKRFYDLIRFAKRYHDPSIVADNVAKRDGEGGVSNALRGKLMNEENWFLNWKGQIGMK